jgi:nucleoside phosphorylase
VRFVYDEYLALMSAMRSIPIEAYQVGVICAISHEMTAARAMLGEEHEPPKKREPQDHNSYVLGKIHDHNVVIACPATGVPGTNAAATVTTIILRTFRGVCFGLMVGLGGGILDPKTKPDIRPGDVAVSQPDKGHRAVVQYDFSNDLEAENSSTNHLSTSLHISL